MGDRRVVIIFKRIMIYSVVIALMLWFVVVCGGPALLRGYVEAGLGASQSQPMGYVIPSETIVLAEIAAAATSGFILQKQPDLQLLVPKHSEILRHALVKMKSQSKNKNKAKAAQNQPIAIYIFSEKPDFFLNYFPQVRQAEVKDDYDFLARMLGARTQDIHTVTDAFFSIIKASLTPYLGDQSHVRIARFEIPGKRGFVTYNLSAAGNYYDCNFLDSKNNYFKLYIKDFQTQLSIDDVLAIVSTVKRI